MTVVPEEVRNLVRKAFSDANDEVTLALSEQPNIYEETLDHILVNTMNMSVVSLNGTAEAII